MLPQPPSFIPKPQKTNPPVPQKKTVFAAFNLSFFPILYFTLPETAGLSLELLDSIFADKSVSPIKRAAEFRKKVKRGETINVTDELEAAMVGGGGEGYEKGGAAEVRLETIPVSSAGEK